MEDDFVTRTNSRVGSIYHFHFMQKHANSTEKISLLHSYLLPLLEFHVPTPNTEGLGHEPVPPLKIHHCGSQYLRRTFPEVEAKWDSTHSPYLYTVNQLIFANEKFRNLEQVFSQSEAKLFSQLITPSVRAQRHDDHGAARLQSGA